MSDGMFGTQHNKNSEFMSLKGKTLEPHTAAPLEGTNSGDARFNGEVNSQDWTKSLKPHEGMTRGSGTGAK